MQYTSRRLSTKPQKTPKQRFSNKRRVIIVAGSIALATALLGAYVVYSSIAWNSAQQAAASVRTDTRTMLDKRLGSASAPSNIEVELSAITKEYKASTVGEACDLPLLVRWQEVLWFTKDATARCQRENKEAREVLEALDKLRVYVVQSNMIAKKLTETAKTANAKKLNFADAKGVWQSALTNIETQAVDGSVVAMRTAAVDTAKGIIVAYEAVQAAEKGQDRAKYDAAIATLGTAYDAAAKITESTKLQYVALSNDFLDAYKQL